MNTKQLWTWKKVVQQCRSHSYSSINVASKVRSDAIVAADKLVELVTPELVVLLECMAGLVRSTPSVRQQRVAHALAARIREALEENK